MLAFPHGGSADAKGRLVSRLQGWSAWTGASAGQLPRLRVRAAGHHLGGRDLRGRGVQMRGYLHGLSARLTPPPQGTACGRRRCSRFHRTLGEAAGSGLRVRGARRSTRRRERGRSWNQSTLFRLAAIFRAMPRGARRSDAMRSLFMNPVTTMGSPRIIAR